MAPAIFEEPSNTKHFDADEATDPLALVKRWLHEAAITEPNDPDAAALATSTPDGVPSVRMVLIKQVCERGFSFYTNAESRKGRELQANPRAAICFHWKTQRRQVRASGRVTELPPEEADRYFHTRSRRSQIGAAVSAQSRPLETRATLEGAADDFENRCPGVVPRPAYWRGYILEPEQIEFWQDGAFRLHDRMLFTRAGECWQKIRLYP